MKMSCSTIKRIFQGCFYLLHETVRQTANHSLYICLRYGMQTIATYQGIAEQSGCSAFRSVDLDQNVVVSESLACVGSDFGNDGLVDLRIQNIVLQNECRAYFAP